MVNTTRSTESRSQSSTGSKIGNDMRGNPNSGITSLISFRAQNTRILCRRFVLAIAYSLVFGVRTGTKWQNQLQVATADCALSKHGSGPCECRKGSRG